MGIVSKEALLSKRTTTEHGFAEDLVPVPGLGGEVRVRGLSRWEAMHVQGMQVTTQREIETIKLAMVDPPMNAEEVRAWMKAGGAGEFEPVSQKIQELSGMHKTAAKEAYEKLEDEDGAEFRVLPGGEAGQDDLGNPGDAQQ